MTCAKHDVPSSGSGSAIVTRTLTFVESSCHKALNSNCCMERGESDQRSTSGKGSTWAKGVKMNRPPERNPYVIDFSFIQNFCNKTCRNVFGEIPGSPVGSTFANRIECSEAGVHGPWRAGIHGNQNDGAFSIVLFVFTFCVPWHAFHISVCSSGGYEDDEDHGDTLYVTYVCLFFLGLSFAYLSQNLHWPRCLLRRQTVGAY